MLLVLLLAVASFWIAPVAVGPIKLSTAEVMSLLGSVFVVTLFVERAQEVILTNWRAYGSEALDLAIRVQEQRVLRLERGEPGQQESGQQSTGSDAGSLTEARQRLDELCQDKLRYRARTRIYALRIGVIMGVAVSVAGLRTLGVLVPETAVMAFGLVQQVIFHTMDVIITGGVIAGGSDGIHKMAEWYRLAMESRSRQLRGHSGAAGG